MKRDYIEDIEGGERRTYVSPVEIRDEGEAKFFEGMAVPFGEVTDLGYFTEEISREAFAEVMDDDVRGLFNHDPDVVLGRNKSGTMTLTVNDKGVFYRISYNPNDPDHVRVMEKVKRGDVSQSSYAFSVKDETWNKRDGKDHRVITKIKRWYDVAPVTYPANQNTTVAKRSLDAIEKRKKISLMVGDKVKPKPGMAHMPMHEDMVMTISEISTESAMITRMEDGMLHKWYVESELEKVDNEENEHAAKRRQIAVEIDRIKLGIY